MAICSHRAVGQFNVRRIGEGGVVLVSEMLKVCLKFRDRVKVFRARDKGNYR